MTEFDRVLSDIFDNSAEHRLELDVEREMIARAQFSDEEATLALLYAYAPVLRAQAAKHSDRLGVDDARADAVGGLLSAIHAFDLSEHDGRLAGIAHGYVADALKEHTTEAVTVPSWQRRRFSRIMAEAEGDFSTASALAPDRGMRTETFHAIYRAVFSDSLDEDEAEGSAPVVERAHPVWQDQRDEYAAADDYALARIALRACGSTERDVARHAYGFISGEAMSDGEVAEAMSLRDLGPERVGNGESVISRATVQRRRKSGLGAMRKALYVE